MSMTYRIVIRGVRDGFALEQVITALTPMFGVTGDALRTQFATPPFIAKKGLDIQTAANYQAALEGHGCDCMVQPEFGASPSEPPQVTPVELSIDVAQKKIVSRVPKVANVPVEGTILAKMNSIWRGVKFLLKLLFVVGVVALGVAECNSPPAPKRDKAQETCEDKIMARVQVEAIVRKNLKAPSTAEFSPLRGNKVEYYGGCKFEVWGYVDAQNSFGAKIRSQYDVIVQYDKAIDGWVPIRVQID